MLINTGSGGWRTNSAYDMVFQTPVIPPVSLNDTAAGIVYSGVWTYSPHRGNGDYQDDVHATARAYDSFAYTFTGTGITYVAEKSADEGAVEILVDGVVQGTVSCYTSASNVPQQTIYRVSGLPPGQHTLKVVNLTSGYWLVVDKLVVQG